MYSAHLTASLCCSLCVLCSLGSLYSSFALSNTDSSESHAGTSFTPQQRHALDSIDFPPMPKPGPMDWLANYYEPGQTYKEFLITPHNRPNKKRHILYLAPVEKINDKKPPSMALLKEFAELYFGMEVKIEASLCGQTYRFSSRINSITKNKQYLTRDILTYLQRIRPDDAFCILAISTTDLYPDSTWNFVFGEASLKQRVGVFSFARYASDFYRIAGHLVNDDNDDLFFLRCCKIVAHETGHMFGMNHCIAYQCLMNGCNHLGELDSQPLHLCPVCLKKLQNSVGFNCTERYKKLAAFYKKAGLDNEAAWVERRLW
jgi:archaemetzincin